MLNKYPVIPNHFILATKQNKKQTHVLEQDDLEATYACLKAWQAGDSGNNRGRLFAFFNSGDHSGASQPHRHLQFLPVEDMRQGEQSTGWDTLINSIVQDGTNGKGKNSECCKRCQLSTDTDTTNQLLQHHRLPFVHFAHRFEAEPSGTQLLHTYNTLYQHAKQAIDDFISTHPGQLDLHESSEGDLPISYNLAMTIEGIAIVPRRNEGHMLRRDDGTDIGFVQLNGTVLGGTLMVKFEEEWNVLRENPKKLDTILEAIGIPTTSQATKL